MFTHKISIIKTLLLSVAALLFSGLLHAADLTAVALSQDNALTRVTLSISADAKFHYFGLSSPDRLVLDLTGVEAKLSGRNPSGGVVKKIRTGLRNSNDLRVVFDLASAATVKVDKTRSGNGITLTVLLQTLGANTANQSPKKTAVEPPAPVKTVQPVARPTASTSPREVKVDVKKRRPVRVVIDAGHGGKDTGAIGPAGTREKDVALAMSMRLYNTLKDSPDFAPVLSRNGDRYLKLRERIGVARTQKADAFVSIHANSFTSRNVRGGSVYALSIGGATSEHARWLAERENSADLVGGVSIHDKENSLASVLLDLSQTATLEASLELANNVLKGLEAIGPLHKKTVQQAGFLVLKSPDIPSILVETAYISNPKEERKLRDVRFQQKVANAIFRGLRDFFVANPPPGTLFAQHGGDYIVRSGDSLSALAARWGTTVQAVRERNKLRNNDLEVGQALVIP